jgi:hypothetical protein
LNKGVRFTQSTRKHRVGRAHALYVINLYDSQEDPEDPTRLRWLGSDVNGRELEIIGIDLGEYLLVIHVMPTRRVKNYGNEEK